MDRASEQLMELTLELVGPEKKFGVELAPRAMVLERGAASGPQSLSTVSSGVE